MLNIISNESLPIIFGLIQSDDSSYVKMMENLDVVFWCVASSFKFTGVVQWTHKGNELTWNDPIQITIFDFFIIFVLFVVEFFAVVPSKFYGKFEAF